MPKFEHKKAAQLINYIASKQGGSISKMKVYKLIWLINRLHLRRFGRMVTNDTHFALPHGPVPSNTSNCIQSDLTWGDPNGIEYFSKFLRLKANDEIITIAQPDTLVFSKSDINVIEEVLQNYGQLSAANLRHISHEYPEWKRYKTELEAKFTSFPMKIDDFFGDYDDGKGLFSQPQDYLDAIKEEYLENV